VTVRTLHQVADLQRARVVFDRTWPLPGGGTTIEANLIRAIEHSGGYVAAAFPDGSEGPDGSDGRAAVGAAVGFLGRHRGADGRWETHLHSHMAAVLAAWQDRHVGTAIKMHQRAWALRHDVPVVAWTFDPLVRRNARFNLLKLGAGVTEYLPDFYGPMSDEVNAGDRSDRLLAWWQVGSDRAAAAAAGRLEPYQDPADAAGGLQPYRDPPAGAVVVPLPRDVVALRRTDPEAAIGWRMQVRDQLVVAMSAGYVVDGVTSEGSYVLLPPSATSTAAQEER
jgi:predicted GNAT superfamily acetyltransferase